MPPSEWLYGTIVGGVTSAEFKVATMPLGVLSEFVTDQLPNWSCDRAAK
jgi:hypothetical protein